MNYINIIFFYILIFSILAVSRTSFKLIVTLLQETPQKFELSGRALIFLGLFVSYIITYIFKI